MDPHRGAGTAWDPLRGTAWGPGTSWRHAYSKAEDQWIGRALQARHLGTAEQALQAYDDAFKRFAETAHSLPLHEQMRKSYTDLSDCPPVDNTVATKIKAQHS